MSAPYSTHVNVFSNIEGERVVRLNGKIVKARVCRDGIPLMDTTTPVPKSMP
jgi:hypothetical protein